MGYKVKGWDRFQHFKDRKPIWIKLYREILDDLEWHELDGDSAKALVMLWLIASEDEGRLPEIKKIAFRLRMPEQKAKSLMDKLYHWLEQDDINPISSVHQVDALEKRREETEKSNNGAIAPDDVSEQVWIDYLKLRKGKKAAVTQTAIDGLRREGAKAGLSLEEVMRLCCANGWQGFKADWVEKKQNGKPVVSKPWFLESASAIKAKGKELGIPDCDDFPTYRYQVFQAAGITKEVYQKAEADWR